MVFCDSGGLQPLEMGELQPNGCFCHPFTSLINTRTRQRTVVLPAPSQSDNMASDPVSVGYLVLTLVQVMKNAYSLISSIKDSAPKIDRIYYRMIAEKMTTEAWANQMRTANGRDSAKLDEVTKLLSKLVEYVKAAEDKYAKVELKRRRVPSPI